MTSPPPGRPDSELLDANRLFYNAWKVAYLMNGCQTNQYYIKYQNSGAITVSEAHGYGMVIFALMAGHDANAQVYFDGMYRFFTNHQSSITPYLMGWQEDPGCVFASGGNDSATDGDLDHTSPCPEEAHLDRTDQDRPFEIEREDRHNAFNRAGRYEIDRHQDGQRKATESTYPC